MSLLIFALNIAQVRPIPIKNDNEIWVWEKTYIKIALIRTLQKLICGLLNFNALSNQKIL